MTARQRFTRQLADGLKQRQAEHLERSLSLPSGIDFTSNDYLGVARSEALAQMFSSQPETIGASASRLLRGHHQAHARAESRLAAFCGTQASLLFSSGFSLNTGIYSALMGPNDRVFSDELNHASIIDGLRLSKATKRIFPHQDFSALERLLQNKEETGQTFVVTESLFSMDGDITDLKTLVVLCEKYDALLVVDEAHSTGLFGERGSGLIEEQDVRERVLLSIHTAGKALGTQGAWVASDDIVIRHLINHCRSFIYSTGISPHLANALVNAVNHIESSPELRRKASHNAEYFRTQAQERKLPLGRSVRGPIIPILIGEAGRSLKVAKQVQDAGFDVRAIRPPTVPPGSSRLRVVIHAVHDQETLSALAYHIEKALKENP